MNLLDDIFKLRNYRFELKPSWIKPEYVSSVVSSFFFVEQKKGPLPVRSKSMDDTSKKIRLLV